MTAGFPFGSVSEKNRIFSPDAGFLQKMLYLTVYISEQQEKD